MKFPFYNQPDAMDCGPTCLRMIAKHYGRNYTLAYLKEKYPEKEFILIMGGDNLESLHKWKNVQQIISEHQIYVYKRPDSKIPTALPSGNIKLFEAPLMSISSSFIRQAIKYNKNVRYFLPDKVNDYIKDMLLYG